MRKTLDISPRQQRWQSQYTIDCFATNAQNIIVIRNTHFNKSPINTLLNILIRKKYFIPLYTRNRLVALVVCLGVFSHSQSMAQTNRHFPFNTVGDAYGKTETRMLRIELLILLMKLRMLKTSPIHQWIASESLFRLFHCH